MREKQSVSKQTAGPTPLDEIRQAEANAAVVLFQAQQETRARQQAAKKQAVEMEKRAQQNGAQAGLACCKQQIEEARRQTEKQVAEARAKAASMTHQGQDRVSPAVRWAVQFVLGISSKDGQS